MDFKEKIRTNKHLILGLKIKTGQKVWEFAGAGDSNLMFRLSVSGLDVTQNSSGKFWVEYEKVNPVIKKTLIEEIDKIESIIDRLNGTGEVSKDDVSLKKTYQEFREEIGAKKAVPKTAKQLGFIPANELELY